MTRQSPRVMFAAFLLSACGSSGGTPDAGVPADAALDLAMAVSDAAAASSSDVGALAQEFCSPTWVNAAGCPATRAAGTCANPGLRCAYPESNGSVEVATCDPTTLQWGRVGHWCRATCPSLMMFDHVVTCEGTDLPCEDDARFTDYERASRAVDVAASGCLGSEFSVDIVLVDGCATSFVLEGLGADRAADCLRGTLAGHRISCGRSLDCLTVARSTLVTP